MSKNYIILNGTVKFDGNCLGEEGKNATLSYCGSICCRRIVVLLTDEEKNRGKYEYSEVTPDCQCSTCQLMRKTNQVALKKKPDGSCQYLNGSNRCSIYEDRPQRCRSFKCEEIWWNLVLPQNIVQSKGL